VEQHTGSQYDDDLTVGMDEYDSLQTGNVDLFEFVGDEESPITRLKTIILSIDWEISDDILRQFNIELLDLKDIWANDKINLVYVQALEKISKYIYQEKANANPNAIKLLLNFYSNLEKIVSTESMPEEEKKRLLMEDVEKFEKLKKQISRSSGKTQVKKAAVETTFKTTPSFRMDEPLPTDAEHEDPLLNLKAIVFGMDWEITEADLNNLGEEVRRLEKRFSNSKAKLIFLQGIGALGAYINLKRSNAHADAFKLLHSFFLSLETCVRNGLTGEDEKRLLMPEVEKFNAFKAAIAFTLSPESMAVEGAGEEDISAEPSSGGSDIAPAFADLPEEVHGFQEEEEAASLGADAQMKVDGQIDRFFDEEKASSGEGAGENTFPDSSKSELIGEMESRLQGFFGDEAALQQTGDTSQDIALQGVMVETEADDDSDEEALPRLGDELAPALSENIEESSFSEEAIAGELGETEPLSETEDRVAGLFSAPDETRDMEDISAALQGVEVETEADDDADEEPLPRRDEELAPALFALDDETEEAPEKELPLPEESLGIEGRLADFFDDHVVSAPLVDDQIALKGVDVGTEEEDFSEEDESSKEEFSPAVYSLEENITEDVTPSSIFQEETAPEMDDYSRMVVADESTQVSGVFEAEDASLGGEIETEKDVDIEEKILSFKDVEQTAVVSEGVENLFFDAEEKLPEEEVPVDFEDHLKEFFEEGGEETVIKEQPEIDFSEVLAETDKSPESSALGTFSLDEESTPIEAEESVLVVDEDHIETKETADFDTSLVFEMDEEVSPARTEEMIVEQEEAGEFKFGFDEEKQDNAPDLEGPESDLFFAKEEEFSFAEEKVEEPVIAAVAKESSDTFPVLQEDEDFIDYIEGVEFDSEEDSLGSAIEPVSQEEEVVFEAVDEESIHEGRRDEEITFDALEEELDKYFTEHADQSEKGDYEREKPGKADEFFEEAETLGQSLEEGLVGSEIQTDQFLGVPGAEKPYVSGGEGLLENERLFGERGPHSPGFVVPEREIGPSGEEDPLSRLRNCVASLGLEINDSILGSLFDEVNNLQNLWISEPAEKTFLQLLSTVARHIDHYRHEASPEAHGLLMSVFDKLERARLAGVDKTEVQESLLSETTKVLLWQQKMLIRRTVDQGEDLSTVFEPVDDDTEKITRIVKDELAMLRQSFRSEMSDLLHQYFEKDTSRNDNR
jgi:pilus assembly protein FimV